MKFKKLEKPLMCISKCCISQKTSFILPYSFGKSFRSLF